MNAGYETEYVTTKAGVRLAVTCMGQGPLVLLMHGFPESWYSWRHQMETLAAGGYRAAALHMRGYGLSDKPDEIEAYTIAEHAGDIAEVIAAMSPQGATVVGHDWGAVQVQAAALIHPDLVRAMVVLSAPVAYPPKIPPTKIWPGIYGDILFYQSYFQSPGVAEAEFEADLPRFVRLFFHSLSGEGDANNHGLHRPKDSDGLLAGLPEPDGLPDWLSREDFDFYVESFRKGGLRGPLNRYRNPDRDWELMLPYADQPIRQPSLFIGGKRDPSRYMVPGQDRYDDPTPRLADARGIHLLDGVGHWIQQEAAAEVSSRLLAFLNALDHPQPVRPAAPQAR